MSCCGSQKKKVKQIANEDFVKAKSSNLFTKILLFIGSIVIYPVFPFILFYIMFVKK